MVNIDTATPRLRLAVPADLPALRELIPASVRVLGVDYYTPRQIESAIQHVFGADTQLVADGTYFVVEAEGQRIVGCGGWSRRRKLYGGDQVLGTSPCGASDDLLDPATEPAYIRAFFTAPGWQRRGVASMIMRTCFVAAREAGFTHLELGATLPGVKFYLRWGFSAEQTVDTTLPDGTAIAFVRMSAKIVGQSSA